MNDILKNYVCLNPFSYLEVHKDSVYCCCPSWLNTPIGKTNELDTVWKDDTLKKIQDSVLDGSYSYCDKTQCPYISELYYNNVSIGLFQKKSEFNRINYADGPTRVSLCFDSSCNLACPSCRVDFIVANYKDLIRIEKTMQDISNLFGKTVSFMSVSGTADTFASKTFRKLLIDFDYEKFPNVKSLYIQTNGLLLTEDMWNALENTHKIVNTIGISIDAGTKETYNIVRLGGDWDVLMNNLKFISQINKTKEFSFVVQDTNYKEMLTFYDLIMGLNPKGSFKIYFSKIANWGTYTDAEYLQKQIWSESHPEFPSFLEELRKVAFKYKVVTNMNDIIDKYSLKRQNTLI